MRRAWLPVLLACALTLGGCESQRDQVRAKVEQLTHAAADRDYRTICREVLAPALLDHLIESGIPCRIAVRAALTGVRDPTLSIGRITVHGSRAVVLALSLARGQQAALTEIGLVRTAHGWRVQSLGQLAG